MNRFVLVILSFAIFVNCYSQVTAKGDTSDFTGKKFYGIKSCRLVFKFFNGPHKGEKTLIFDDWGNSEKMYGVTQNDTALMSLAFQKMSQDSTSPFGKMMGKSMPKLVAETHELIIKTPKEIFKIDLDQKKGYKQPNISLTPELENEFNQNKKVVRQGEVAGRLCEIQEEDGFMRLWMWNKIALKKEAIKSTPEMRIEEYAIEVDTSYVIKANEFSVPEGITIK